MKITEKELEEKIKIFENENIIIQLDNLIEARFEMNNILIDYNINKGFIHIEDSKNDNEIRINIVSAYEIDLECMKLQILLDEDIKFIIMKK